MAKHLSMSIVVSFVILFLASCEQLGIEITTVKGNWQSDKFDNGKYITLQLSEDGSFDSYLMVTDTTYSKRIRGTWQNKEDSLFLYAQGEKAETLVVEMLSMDNMTLKYGQRYAIMNRKYNNPNNKYEEVCELKGGIWYDICIHWIIPLAFVWGCIYVVGCGVDWIKSKLN